MRRFAPAFLEARRLVAESGAIRFASVRDYLGPNGLFVGQTSGVVNDPLLALAANEELRQLTEMRISEAIGTATPDVRASYRVLLGLASHDLSAMRELLGMPKRVLYAAQRHGGRCISAAFDYERFVCHYETADHQMAHFDASIQIYGADQIVRVQYDTPYIRNLPVRLAVMRGNGRGGVVESSENPCWGDAFVEEWKAFFECIRSDMPSKASPTDFRADLELFREMVAHMSHPTEA